LVYITQNLAGEDITTTGAERIACGGGGIRVGCITPRRSQKATMLAIRCNRGSTLRDYREKASASCAKSTAQ